jgi:putative oxidoreductase
MSKDSSSATDLGLLLVRLSVGGALFAHGAQKLFGWFGGGGIDGTAKAFDSIGFTPGKANAIAAGLGEAGGGALLALGLATPSAGAAVAGTMAVASSTHASNGFFAGKGGLEFPAILGTVGASLALTGPGRYSVDHLFGHRVNRPWMRNLALALVPPAAAAVIVRRRQAVLAQPAPEPPAADQYQATSEEPAATEQA